MNASETIKYTLLAHEKGTDNYVLATKSGTVMACGEGLVNQYRKNEQLIPFETLAQGLLKEQEELERIKVIPVGTAQDHFVKRTTGMFTDAIVFLGCPPKEETEFFSVPKTIVDKLKWTPKS